MEKICVGIDSMFHRDQFDDWLAGGRVEYKGKVYYWSARDSSYGFGWEIDPIPEEDWADIPEKALDKVTALIEKCLCEHETEYVYDV